MAACRKQVHMTISTTLILGIRQRFKLILLRTKRKNYYSPDTVSSRGGGCVLYAPFKNNRETALATRQQIVKPINQARVGPA